MSLSPLSLLTLHRFPSSILPSILHSPSPLLGQDVQALESKTSAYKLSLLQQELTSLQATSEAEARQLRIQLAARQVVSRADRWRVMACIDSYSERRYVR